MSLSRKHLDKKLKDVGLLDRRGARSKTHPRCRAKPCLGATTSLRKLFDPIIHATWARPRKNRFRALDREAVYRRFFAPKQDLTDLELEQVTHVDFSRVVALVATISQAG